MQQRKLSVYILENNEACTAVHSASEVAVVVVVFALMVEAESEMVLVEMEYEVAVIVVAQGVVFDSVLFAYTVIRTLVDKQVNKLVERIAVHRMACKLLRIVVAAVVLEPNVGSAEHWADCRMANCDTFDSNSEGCTEMDN